MLAASFITLFDLPSIYDLGEAGFARYNGLNFGDRSHCLLYTSDAADE